VKLHAIQLSLATILSLSLAACKKDEDKNQQAVTPAVETASVEQQVFGPNGLPSHIDAQFELKNLTAPQSVIQTIHGIPGSRRDNLDKVQISCLAQQDLEARQLREGLVLFEGSQATAVGNFSRRVQNSFLRCNRDLSASTSEQRSFDNHHQRSNETRLNLGESLEIQVMTSRDRFRNPELFTIIVYCSLDAETSLRSKHKGLHLLNGGRLAIVDRLVRPLPRFEDADSDLGGFDRRPEERRQGLRQIRCGSFQRR
jgi:hypothetical protein